MTDDIAHHQQARSERIAASLQLIFETAQADSQLKQYDACKQLQHELTSNTSCLEASKILKELEKEHTMLCAQRSSLIGIATTAARSKLNRLMSLHSEALDEQSAQHEAALAELRLQHAADAEEWERALARRNSNSRLFRYTVRGSGHSGSVPLSIFQAEPDSVLAHMYAGEWDYTQDESGQAVLRIAVDDSPPIVILCIIPFSIIHDS